MSLCQLHQELFTLCYDAPQKVGLRQVLNFHSAQLLSVALIAKSNANLAHFFLLDHITYWDDNDGDCDDNDNRGGLS